MKDNVTLVEVSVELMGLFVRTESIFMYDNLEDAKQGERTQAKVAEALMEAQGEEFFAVALEGGIRLEKHLNAR